MKKTTTIRTLFVTAVAVMFSPLAAHAGLIYLDPNLVDPVETGDSVSFDIWMDFSGDPTLGGGFDIFWDSTALSFTGLVNNDIGDPFVSTDPFDLTVDPVGLLDGWFFGADPFGFGLEGPLIVGSITFEVLAGMGNATSILLGQNLFGDFLSFCDFLDPSCIPELQVVDYAGADLARAAQQVPEPATLALFAFGLAAIGLTRRRRRV